MRETLRLPPALAAQQRLMPLPNPAIARIRLPSAALAPTNLQRAGGLPGKFNAARLLMAAYGFDNRGLSRSRLATVPNGASTDTNFARFLGNLHDYDVTLMLGNYSESRMNVRCEPGAYRVQQTR